MRLGHKSTSRLYILSILSYTLISWVLLLRNDWAIKALANFRPSLDPLIFNLQSWALAHHLNTIPTVFLFITIVFLFAAYSKLVQLINKKKLSIKKTLLILSISISTLFLSYPSLSTDIFDYILINRVVTTYHHNPWTTPSNTFLSDPFINLGQWQHITSVYGPLHHLITVPLTHLAGSGFVANITLLRLSTLIFFIITLALISKIANQLKLKNPKPIILAFALNPALLLEFIAHAHNDIYMVGFMLASILALSNRQYFLSGILLAFGFLIKLYAISLLPFFIAFLYFTKQSKSTINLIVGFLLTTAAGLFVMGPASTNSYLQLMGWVFTLKLNSLPNLLNFIPDYIFTLPFIALALYRVFISPKITSLALIFSEYSLLTFIYLLFVVPLYWPWYIIWIFPFVLLTKHKHLINAGVALTLTSTLYYPLLMLSHRSNYSHPIWTPTIYLTIAALPGYYLFRHFLETRK